MHMSRGGHVLQIKRITGTLKNEYLKKIFQTENYKRMPPKLAKLFLTLVKEKTILFMFLFILKKIKEVIPTVAGFCC